MKLLSKFNNFVNTEPRNERYSPKSLHTIEYEWGAIGITPGQFCNKYGKKLFRALKGTVDTSLFGIANMEGSEQEANIVQVELVEKVFSICLERYGYKSFDSLMGDRSSVNRLTATVKQMFGIRPVKRLDAKEEIIKDSVCEFWDGFQRIYYNTYHDEKGYVRPYDAKYVGKLFEYELSGVHGWKGF